MKVSYETLELHAENYKKRMIEAEGRLVEIISERDTLRLALKSAMAGFARFYAKAINENDFKKSDLIREFLEKDQYRITKTSSYVELHFIGTPFTVREELKEKKGPPDKTQGP